MQRIVENLTNKFNAKITSDYTRMGWAYVREGKTFQIFHYADKMHFTIKTNKK